MHENRKLAPLTGIAFASNWLISKLNQNPLSVKTTRMTTNRSWLYKTDLSGLVHLVIVTMIISTRAVCSVPDVVIRALRVTLLSDSGYALIGYEYCARIM